MADNAKILIVDDLKDIRFILANLLSREGYKTITADNGFTALELVSKEPPDIVVMDIVMPKMDGVEAMKRIKKIDPLIPIIFITAYGKVDTAVHAIKLGAYDYITKPFDNEKLIITIKNALTERSLKQEVKTLRSNLNNIVSLRELMGSSKAIKRLIDQVNHVSPTNFTVVLYGETGAGKELVARAIHSQSMAKEGRLVAVDCGAIPETLIESELFGYEKGAFTGAEGRKEGYFELASNGTLFLDEIGNLALNMQGKLLRVLEGHRIRRIGGKKDIEIDVRVIAAGNERLERLVESGRFRKDLYHRLNEFTIEIPPLRDRKEDIIYLSKRFLDATNQELHKSVKGLTKEALDCLLNYNWPGNVRELRNVIRKAALLAEDVIEPHHLSIEMIGTGNNSLHLLAPIISTSLNNTGIEMGIDNGLSLRSIVKKGIKDMERRVIKDVLKSTGGNKSKAAKVLNIDYKTIHYKIKEYGIQLFASE